MPATGMFGSRIRHDRIHAVAAASPATANRLSTASITLDPLYFFYRHLAWQVLALGTLFGVSMLARDNARRFGLLLAAGMTVLLFLVPVLGAEINGARRWINLGMQFQPSEFLKPGFAIATAWILSWRMRDPNMPVAGIATAYVALIAALMMMQPDFGGTILFAGVWFVAMVLSGIDMKRMGAVIGATIAGLTATYFLYDNARHRIDSFIGGGTAYDQVDLGARTLTAGGWTGAGYGLGIRKMSLPEAHTDYIYSVIGEEFGLIACAVIVMLYCAVAVRVLMRLVEEEDFTGKVTISSELEKIEQSVFIKGDPPKPTRVRGVDDTGIAFKLNDVKITSLAPVGEILCRV
jgi:cell division protein FtsW